ncbi:MAG: ABC transporter substrate-binding protein [Alistipes sp.]|nr:ABC transporter substrate-binding protein [Alistipes sp.]
MQILLFVATLFILVSCTSRGEKRDFATAVTIYQPAYASGFEIVADGEQNTLLRVTRPWQGEAIAEQSLAIFADKESAEGYSGQRIIGHARRVVCMSTSHIAMLDALGLIEAVVGVSGKQYVMNEYVARNVEVADVGYDSNLDYERLLLLRPDVVLLYGVSAENTSVTTKLRELRIPYLYLGDYVEQSPLGKAEWMVAVAEIMGCRERGEELFADIVERYEAVKSGIEYKGERPKVMFNTPYQDVWYMPSDESYMVRLVEDSGGEYIYKGHNTSSGSVGISLEEAYMLAAEADVWMNVGQCSTLDELRSAAPHFANVGVVVRGEVYNNNARATAAGGSDFWESAIVRPDVVLEDMATIMRGGEEEMYYHHKLR